MKNVKKLHLSGVKIGQNPASHLKTVKQSRFTKQRFSSKPRITPKNSKTIQIYQAEIFLNIGCSANFGPKVVNSGTIL